MKVSEPVAIVLLAAGGSLRMGQPKQLLSFEDKSLLRRAADEAASSHLGPLVVVLGENAMRMMGELEGLVYHHCVNDDWQAGMGTSIRAGIQLVQQNHPYCQYTLVMLCDQPYVDSNHLIKLANTCQKSEKPIAASVYQGTVGVPACFHHSYFGRLSQLKGSIGARKLLLEFAHDVATVSFPLGSIDIDTPQDYQNLNMDGKA